MVIASRFSSHHARQRNALVGQEKTVQKPQRGLLEITGNGAPTFIGLWRTLIKETHRNPAVRWRASKLITLPTEWNRAVYNRLRGPDHGY